MSTNNKTGIIIQARMGSSRLPAKILMQVNGKPLLQSQIERLKDINHHIYIATTTKSADDAIIDFAEKNNLLYYRGSEENVLSRYYDCAVQFNLDTIVRITSDCPFIDASILSAGINQYLKHNNKKLYLSNTLDRTYPRGADYEVFSFDMLKDAYKNATDISDIEHVTPYIWKNRDEKFEIIQLRQDKNYSHFRLTLDTPEDFKLIKKLIEVYSADKLSIEEICIIMTQHPELPLINSHIDQKKV